METEAEAKMNDEVQSCPSCGVLTKPCPYCGSRIHEYAIHYCPNLFFKDGRRVSA